MAFWKKHIANTITSTSIILGMIACLLVIFQPSWFWAEVFLLIALFTDAVDGKIARRFGSTSAGVYLDDIADFINFGLHPALWIWSITSSLGLAGLYICCIFYRLVRFTMKKQNGENYFSGLPSPAAAVGAMGIMIIHPEPILLAIALGLIAFLTISHIPCMHIGKTGSMKIFPLIILGSIGLVWIYGGSIFALGLTECVLTIAYILVSMIILLIPHYVTR